MINFFILFILVEIGILVYLLINDIIYEDRVRDQRRIFGWTLSGLTILFNLFFICFSYKFFNFIKTANDSIELRRILERGNNNNANDNRGGVRVG